MTRQKKIIYIVALLVSLLLLGLYTTIVLRVSQQSAQERLTGTLQNTTNTLHQAIAVHAQEILFQLDAYAETPMNAAGIGEVLRTLEAAYPDRDFHMAQRTGSIVDAAGTPVGALTNLQPLQTARRQGFSVINYSDTKGIVACIVPMPGHSDYYLLQIEPVDLFLQQLQASLTLNPSYALVFNEYGTPVSNFFWGRSTDSYEMAQSVQHGASDYVARRQGTIQKLPLRKGYNLYIPLTQPTGWFIGARVPISAAAQADAGMMRVHLLVLPLWAVSAAFLIAVDILNDRKQQQSMR